MLLLSVLACLRFPDTDQDPVDDTAQDTGSADGCPSDWVKGDTSTVDVNAFQVDALGIYTTGKELCLSESGLEAQITLDVSGDEAVVDVYASQPEVFNLPDGNVTVSVSGDLGSWSNSDIYVGTLTIRDLADLQLEATNGSDSNLVLGVSWSTVEDSGPL